MAGTTEDAGEYPIKIQVHTFTDVGVFANKCLLTEFLHPEFELPSSTDSKFRWFHLPVNNMAWVEKCIAKLVPELSGMDEKAWALKLRPALSQIRKPLHSRQMEPSCISAEDVAVNADTSVTAREPGTPWFSPQHSKEEGLKRPLLTLYLPYMNWDYYDDFRELQATYKGWEGVTQQDDSLRRRLERILAQHLEGNLPVHPRRTLDQFYYSSLPDTTARDADQTISKWSGADLDEDGRPRAVKDSLLIMVDQLWCWVLNEKIVLSFFPSQEAQDRRYDEERTFTDLYHSIRDGYTSCRTVWDLYSILVKEATTHLFRQENRKFMDLVGVYRWVTSKKAAYQTMYFQEFQHPDSGESLSPTALDDRRELKLVLEVADIIDELKMIRHLIDTQREVLRGLIIALRKLHPSSDAVVVPASSSINISSITSRDNATTIVNLQHQDPAATLIETTKLLAQAVAVPARDSIIFTEEVLVSLLAEIATITKDAEYTHQMLLNLLDLKQKTASLAEARSTTKQGRAIMLFTIITIVFLPLSFFTSYFGQNVSEITGSDQNPTTWDLWRIGTPITLAVILSALCIAFFIMYPDSPLLSWRHRLLFWRYRRNRGQPFSLRELELA